MVQENPMAHEHFKSCISACNDCAVACEHCAASCLAEQDVAKMARCIRLDIDCAEICRLAVGYMARGSELAADVCELCASICDACAQECDKLKDDEVCKATAKSCRDCAKMCRTMSKHKDSK